MLLARTRELRAAGHAKAELTPETLARLLNSSGLSTTAGLYVTPARAMGQTTVNACINIISGILASLPVKIVERINGTRTAVDSHPALDLLAKPNDWQTSYEFLRALVANLELHGNSYGFKVKSGDGYTRQVLPLEPEVVTVRQKADWKLGYTVSGDSTPGLYGSDKVFHFRGLSMNGYRGISTIHAHKEIIALAIQVERHGAALFKNGAQLGKVLEFPEGLSETAYEKLKNSIEAEFTGAGHAWKTLILEEGGRLRSHGMTGVESQFIEMQRFLVGKISSIWGIPSFVMNDTEKSTTWGSGLEQITGAFKKFSLEPRLRGLTDRLAYEFLLVAELGKLQFKFDTIQFTSGEFKDRVSAYAEAINNSILSPNETREREGLNPYEGGDEYRQPMNMTGESDESEDE